MSKKRTKKTTGKKVEAQTLTTEKSLMPEAAVETQPVIHINWGVLTKGEQDRKFEEVVCDLFVRRMDGKSEYYGAAREARVCVKTVKDLFAVLADNKDEAGNYVIYDQDVNKKED